MLLSAVGKPESRYNIGIWDRDWERDCTLDSHTSDKTTIEDE